MTDFLRDPEREMEELGHPINEPVQAHSLKEAKKKCEKLAQEYERELTEVRTERYAWFRCFFQ
ncbi:hypothetical protein [Limnofasciculus baicalensis]|uniref:Uncharacterized protein n=1 Tax=Limnofasciculus baicalensis BBK-W-15 TaxID=2699891 RepID=A0AAE3KMY3_9CYAN|nr:hypothetical protein [Limnofasciculus baicalensis]MCP2728083.1 hypothetical protein [Limnofasciculus baicalensis BBK-W-15]